jgi:hypothetical protein
MANILEKMDEKSKWSGCDLHSAYAQMRTDKVHWQAQVKKKSSPIQISATTPIEKCGLRLESDCFSSSMRLAENKLFISVEPTSDQRNFHHGNCEKNPGNQSCSR